jgi:hypothetical protein
LCIRSESYEIIQAKHLRRDAVLRMAFPVVAASQQDDSIGPQRCFDEQSPESNTSKEQKAHGDLPVNFRFWLTEDAAYIIAPEERCAFSQLGSDEERDIFIEQFWYRRSPDPIVRESFPRGALSPHCFCQQ